MPVEKLGSTRVRSRKESTQLQEGISLFLCSQSKPIPLFSETGPLTFFFFFFFAAHMNPSNPILMLPRWSGTRALRLTLWGYPAGHRIHSSRPNGHTARRIILRINGVFFMMSRQVSSILSISPEFFIVWFTLDRVRTRILATMQCTYCRSPNQQVSRAHLPPTLIPMAVQNMK